MTTFCLFQSSVFEKFQWSTRMPRSSIGSERYGTRVPTMRPASIHSTSACPICYARCLKKARGSSALEWQMLQYARSRADGPKVGLDGPASLGAGLAPWRAGQARLPLRRRRKGNVCRGG